MSSAGFFRRLRRELLSKNRFSRYFLYAVGEIVLVVIGILIALHINNRKQLEENRQKQIDNLENFYLSFNESMQIEPLIGMLKFALQGENEWIEYLENKKAYSDSLLNYGYYIGVTAFISPNMGFYESLKQKGLENINDKDLRNRLSIIYEQYFPQIQKSMKYFNDRFGDDRLKYFKAYYNLGSDAKMMISSNNQYSFDYSMYTIDSFKNEQAMLQDGDFLEFVIVSKLFHERLLIFLDRVLDHVYKTRNRIYGELSFIKYGNPTKRKVTFILNEYREASEMYVSGDFNNWRPLDDGRMMLTPEGWVRSFELFPGEYEYKFIVNGEQWIIDPKNPDSIFVPEVGSYNSILVIKDE